MNVDITRQHQKEEEKTETLTELVEHIIIII